MNRLEREITTLKNKLQNLECYLLLSNERNTELVKNQEQIEHRVNNLEELCKALQEDVSLIADYVNATITRVSDLHGCLNVLGDKDLRCHETMDASDDDNDDEFDLDDYDDKIALEVEYIQHMKKQ